MLLLKARDPTEQLTAMPFSGVLNSQRAWTKSVPNLDTSEAGKRHVKQNMLL